MVAMTSDVIAGLCPRLSGAVFAGQGARIDSNGVQSLATQLDKKRISAVPHRNTVFLRHFETRSLAAFDKL